MNTERLMRRIIALVCSLALIVTSITTWDVTLVSADTATVLIQTKDEARTGLLAEIQDEEINFALNKPATVSRLTTSDGGEDLGVITNGSFSTATGKNAIIEVGRGYKEDRWVQVDLGAAYDSSKINRVALQYKTTGTSPINTGNNGGTYYIQLSLNGLDYIDVGEVSNIAGGAEAIFLDTLTLTEEQLESIPYARYVRMYTTRDLSAYGLQVKGMAVLTDGTTKVSEVETMEVPVIENPESVTVTSSDYCQLEYSFEAAMGHDDYTYYAYVDGARDGGEKTAGETYVVPNLKGGIHTVKVISLKDGFASEGVEQSVEVIDPKDLMTSDRNIALGRTATPSSIRENDNPVNLTDGNLSSQFRTLQSELQANIVIDLGAGYKANIIEMVGMLFITGRYATEYSIDYSEDGEYFETVCTATGDSEFQYAKIDTSNYTLPTVRYVRVNLNKSVAASFGYQLYEIAVISKDKDLSDTDITLNKEQYVYTGTQIKPNITVMYGAQQLQEDVDYRVICENNINAGTVTAILEGSGSFAGNREVEYEIVKADLKDTTINKSFDGNNNIKVEVRYNDVVLTEDADYTYTTSKNSDGDMVIDVSAAGNNFEGTNQAVVGIEEFPVSEVKNVVVESTEINEINVSFENPDTFAGDRQLYDIYIDGNLVDEDVTAGTYTYNNQNAGVHAVKVVAKLNGQTSNGIESDVNVEGRDISNCEIDINEEFIIYDGTEKAADFEVYDSGFDYTLQEGTDYTVEYENNTNAGNEAKIIITGIGLYKGTLEEEFTIVPADIKEEHFDVKIGEPYVFTGKEIAPTVVAIEELQLVEGEDYTVSYEDNINPGTAKITITGIGNYSKELSYTFVIKKKSVANVNITTGFDANKQLRVDVKDTYYNMVKDVDYKYIIVTDAKGNIVVTVTGIGDRYEGTAVKNIAANDNPNAPTTKAPTQPTKRVTVGKTKVVKASKKKSAKKISITLKKVKGAKKYQIRISTKKNSKKVLITKTVKKVKVTIKNKKLINKKKLYVKARAIKTVNKKSYYSKWCKVKKVKFTK